MSNTIYRVMGKRGRITIPYEFHQQVWSCHNHVRSKELCDSKRYSETQIYGAFMRMFNKLY